MLRSLTDPERRALDEFLTDWHRPERHGGARPEQRQPEGDYFIWLVQAGRGYGKTRTGAETVRRHLDARHWRVVNVAGPTWMDVKDTMVYGTDAAPGLMKIWPQHQVPVPKWGDHPHLITHNGGMIRLRSADNPERFRGPQADGGWVDELDAWKPKSMTPAEAFTLFELGIRLGVDPRIIATTTPKRGRLVAKLRKRKDVHVTRGSMLDNEINLASQFINAILEEYGGSRIGRQEIEGELLEEIQGALIKRAWIDETRMRAEDAPRLEDFERITVGVDPSGSVDGDEKGITVGGMVDGDAYLLADLSTKAGPKGWGETAVNAYYRYQANAIVAEKNYGGDMVAHVILTAAERMDVAPPRIKLVSATRGKQVRAQPVATLYEQRRVHHVGEFGPLEDQMCSFTDEGYDGDASPDRGDSWVWTVYDLLVGKRGLSPTDLYGDDGDEEELNAVAS